MSNHTCPVCGKVMFKPDGAVLYFCTNLTCRFQADYTNNEYMFDTFWTPIPVGCLLVLTEFEI
jgi:hypothetical protein